MKKIKRKILGFLSLTSALFIFQACYGTPQDFGLDVYIEGIVRSEKTNKPIHGIKVSLANQPQYDYTSEQGKFKFYIERNNEYKIKFEDIDSLENRLFCSKDTILNNIDEAIFLEMTLIEK